MQCLSELKKIMPSHIQPRFKTAEELLAFHDAESKKQSKRIDEMNRQARIEKILGRSGIQKLHADCGFKNYQIESDEQRKALSMALEYFKGFDNATGGFVFSGNVGTGKNHLATAIVRGLIEKSKSAAIITVAELVQRFRACYEKGSEYRESDLMNSFVSLDLLVLDEIGVQKQVNNDYEINLLNQIIDRRQLNLKPTGMLTNLSHDEMSKLLGARIIDRQMCGGTWISFTWNSYRNKSKRKSN